MPPLHQSVTCCRSAVLRAANCQYKRHLANRMLNVVIATCFYAYVIRSFAMPYEHSSYRHWRPVRSYIMLNTCSEHNFIGSHVEHTRLNVHCYPLGDAQLHVQTVLYSEGFIIGRFYIPKVLYSKTGGCLFLQLCRPI